MTWDGLAPPYATIVADPPWRYHEQRQLTTARRYRPGAGHRYSTMLMDEVFNLPVEELAAKDAHLYLWITNPLLFGDGRSHEGPVDIIERWGFRYVTMLTWVKTGTLGLGYYFRGETEHILFGVRGDAPIPPDKRERNVIKAAKGRHSQKPGAFLDLVERVSPGPYVELFARQPRLGWDSWGYGYEHAV